MIGTQVLYRYQSGNAVRPGIILDADADKHTATIRVFSLIGDDDDERETRCRSQDPVVRDVPHAEDGDLQPGTFVLQDQPILDHSGEDEQPEPAPPAPPAEDEEDPFNAPAQG